MVDKYDLNNIIFNKVFKNKRLTEKKSIDPVGLDSEADETGKPFLFCTPEHSCRDMEKLFKFLFSTNHHSNHFVVYNLKYETGAILHSLSKDAWTLLYLTGETIVNEFKITLIPNKYLKITHKKKSVHIWDIAQFYHSSLDIAAKTVLGEGKIDIECKQFTTEIIKNNYYEIEKYCKKDADLTEKLAKKLIEGFEKLGVKVSKLYSTAYVSMQYFEEKIKYPYLDDLYDFEKPLIQAALRSYRGGKFEVVKKGVSEFWEYDINSAYPFEISKLYDLSCAKVKYSKNYDDRATYAFLKVELNISPDCFHTLGLKMGTVICYPCGYLTSWITDTEYKYLIECKQDVKVLECYNLYKYKARKPFEKEVNRLYVIKDKYKQEGNYLEYSLVKKLLNSLYGKTIQLIQKGEKFESGRLFNPIYAAIITANCRVRVSRMQQLCPSIWAVFTDSIISDTPLPISLSDDIGAWNLSSQGKGCMIGSGIYEIGDKTKLRGFDSQIRLNSLFACNKREVEIPITKVQSWKETIFHGWDIETINKFSKQDRMIDVQFDQKRIWLDDYEKWSDVPTRIVESVPRISTEHFGIL